MQWSEDRRFYLDSHSSHDRPPSLSLHDATGARRATLSRIPAAALAALDLQLPELLTVPAADGHPLQARLYKPRDFDPARRYPLIVYVYGEPNAPAVMDNWRTWPPPGSALWEQVLLDAGYLVATIDSRVATAATKAMENLALGSDLGTAGGRRPHRRPALVQGAALDRPAAGGHVGVERRRHDDAADADAVAGAHGGDRGGARRPTGAPTTPSTPSPI